MSTFSSHVFSFPTNSKRGKSLHLLQLELLKLLDRSLETSDLRLEVNELLLINLLDGLGDLLLVDGVLEHLALLFNVGAGLVELLLGLLNLGVEVDATLDVEVDRGGRRNGEGDAAGRAGGVGTKNVNASDTLAAERLDGSDLLLNGGLRRGVVSLDDDCHVLATDGENLRDNLLLDSSFWAYSLMSDLEPREHPRTSS